MNQILKELGVKEINLGSCIGGDKWIDNSDSSFIESFNPANCVLKMIMNQLYLHPQMFLENGEWFLLLLEGN